MEPQEEHDRQQLRIAELLYERKYHKVCGLRVLSSDINGKRKQREPVKHLGSFFCDWTQRLEPHRHVGSSTHAACAD